jgi:hypothetical protein
MNKRPNPSTESRPRRRDDVREGRALQPAPTGANRGSPAAPVMKQFTKTKTESTGRS